MPVVQKFFVGLIAVALVSTLILPGRQTPQVINAFSSLTSNSIKAAQGR
jgi:hypothetical protein